MDYALHIQQAITSLKNMYMLCQERKHDEAIEKGLEAIAQTRMATLNVRTINGDFDE